MPDQQNQMTWRQLFLIWSANHPDNPVVIAMSLLPVDQFLMADFEYVMGLASLCEEIVSEEQYGAP